MTKIEKARKSAEQIATKFSVSRSAVVWAGNNDFIVVNKGKKILIKNWRLLKMGYSERKEKARQEAVDLIYEAAQENLSYGEMAIIHNYIYNLGKRYGLITEFKENALI